MEKAPSRWMAWKQHLREKFTTLTQTAEEFALMDLHRCFPEPEEQNRVIEFSISRNAQNLILTGDHRKIQQTASDGKQASQASFSRKKPPTFDEFGL